MKKFFVSLILMLSIFSIANAHSFKTEKELYNYYAEIDKKINEELKNSPKKILKDRKNTLKPLYLDVFGADKVLGDNSYLFGFDKNGKKASDASTAPSKFLSLLFTRALDRAHILDV